MTTALSWHARYLATGDMLPVTASQEPVHLV